MAYSFVDSFWVNNIEEYISTTGFDIVWKRMKGSQKLGKDVEEYLKSLAKIENEYSKSLNRLNKGSEIGEDLGVMGQSWIKLKYEFDQVASTHEELSSVLSSQVEKIKTMNEVQDEKKRKCKESVRKCHSHNSTLYNRTLNAEKVYKQKFLENIQCKKQYESTKSFAVSTKDTEKLFNKHIKAVQGKENADALYKNLVDQLEESHKAFEWEIHQALIEFQKLEEERIDMQRNLLWVVLNARSQVSVEEDKCYENVRKTLEQCDIQRDIIDFISNHQTGSTRPAYLKYHNLDETRKEIQVSHAQESLSDGDYCSIQFPNSKKFNLDLDDP
ncbi:Hypothetical predicted protein [Octopus vulgaris]|uniref:Uncharacterized protein n=2 Tax=Octopus TaxID=6643 RepID=A0AA36BKX3_OCTVU|nr:proline-serine-threonine phosphatase-interacting protein 2 [Octopus sinensis]CAI9736059.1 Hypothetical predicted protein [Octopus vulgaris]CAI9736061.1 Hypothetical predicted protein [Octopus vulgaris]